MRTAPPGRVLALIAIVGSLWARNAQAFEVILQAAPLYNVVQLTNAAHTGDSYFSGYGYQAGMRIRFPFIGVSDPKLVMVSVFGGLTSTFGKNTADSTETGNLTRFGGGLDLEIWRLLIGIAYGQNAMTVNYSSTATTLTYSSLGLRGGFVLPLSNYLSVHAGGQYTMGLISSSSGSRGVSESLGFLELQYTLFDLGGDGSKSYSPGR